MNQYIELVKPYLSSFLRSIEGILQRLPNKIVSTISWGLIGFAMLTSILLSNFAGWATIQGLLFEFIALVILRFILIHGWNHHHEP